MYCAGTSVLLSTGRCNVLKHNPLSVLIRSQRFTNWDNALKEVSEMRTDLPIISILDPVLSMRGPPLSP